MEKQLDLSMTPPYQLILICRSH